MTVDLRDQLHELCAFIDEEQGPIALDDVRAHNDSVMVVAQLARPTPSIRRRWLVALAAAAVVVAASLPLLVFTGGNDREGFFSSSEPDVATTPTFAPSSSGWSRVPYDEAVFGGAGMGSVTIGGPGLVAVGSVELEGDGSSAVVWTSVDGITWSRVADDEAVFGGPRSIGMESVTAGGPGLVAVGSADPHDSEDGLVWTSVDGMSWSRVPDEEAIFGGPGEQWIGGVTAGGPGVVAVGWELVGFGADAAVWTSVDGISWSRVPDEEGVFGGPGYNGMAAVTAGGPGVVAVGSAQQDGGQSAAVWTSVDGLIWSRVPHDDAVFGTAGLWMYGVTVGGPGLVAVGNDGEGGAAVWTSVNGLTWSRVPVDEAVFGGAGMSSVFVGGPGLVAVGSVESEESDGGALVWTSVDGITWSRVPDDESVFGGGEMSSVTVWGRGVVAVGGDGENGAVWVAETGE